MSSSFCTFFTAIRTAYVSIPNGRMIQDKRAASWNFYHNAALLSCIIRPIWDAYVSSANGRKKGTE